jgi:hypothetical protein
VCRVANGLWQIANVRYPTIPGNAALQAEYFAEGIFVMQAALAQRTNTTQTRTDLSTIARQYLESHPHFRGRAMGVRIAHEGSNLFVTGRLPTFYLKQLVQEALRHVPGVQKVYNQIDVVSAEGISSARN